MVDSTSHCLFTHRFAGVSLQLSLALLSIPPLRAGGHPALTPVVASDIILLHLCATTVCGYPLLLISFTAPPATYAARLCFYSASAPLLLASSLSISASMMRLSRSFAWPASQPVVVDVGGEFCPPHCAVPSLQSLSTVSLVGLLLGN